MDLNFHPHVIALLGEAPHFDDFEQWGRIPRHVGLAPCTQGNSAILHLAQALRPRGFKARALLRRLAREWEPRARSARRDAVGTVAGQAP